MWDEWLHNGVHFILNDIKSGTEDPCDKFISNVDDLRLGIFDVPTDVS